MIDGWMQAGRGCARRVETEAGRMQWLCAADAKLSQNTLEFLAFPKLCETTPDSSNVVLLVNENSVVYTIPPSATYIIPQKLKYLY